jgi:hypothetical protein
MSETGIMSDPRYSDRLYTHAAQWVDSLQGPAQLWVCPWGICDARRAQECRASTGTTKMKRGCGTYFPCGITPEQAKQMIKGRGDA